MSHVADLSRRAALRLGAGAFAGAAGVSALNAWLDPQTLNASPPQAPTPFDPAPAGSALPTRVSGSFISAARGGKLTNWIIALPPGQTGPLRPVIALHAVRGNANQMVDLGVEDGLAQLVKAGRPAFAVIAVDGGDSYWHRRANGEDSGAMVLNELIPMLATKGLDTSRVGFIGWSMGGYGALLLGSRLGPQRTAGICAVVACTSRLQAARWGRSTTTAIGPETRCSHAATLSSIPSSVDCGTSDRFCPATRQFVAQLRTRPSVASSGGMTCRIGVSSCLGS